MTVSPPDPDPSHGISSPEAIEIGNLGEPDIEKGRALESGRAEIGSTLPVDKRLTGDLFGQIVEEMWQRTQGSQASNPLLRDVFLAAVAHVVEDGAVMVDSSDIARARDWAELPRAPISGAPDQIEYIVASEVAALRPAQVENYIRVRLAPTVEVLERNGVGSEALADIIDKALDPLMGQANAAEIAVSVIGRLMNAPSEERTVGHAVSIGRAALYLDADPGLDGRRDSILGFHACLEAMLVPGEWPGDQMRVARSATSVSANNMSGQLRRALRLANKDMDNDDVLQSLIVLSRISAAAAPPLPIEPERASDLATQLGRHSESAIDWLTAADRMGNVADAWSKDQNEVGWLEAVSGLAKSAVASRDEEVAGMLFNAALSLSRHGDRGRQYGGLYLYALALRVAQEIASGDTRKALLGMGGMKSAANFLSLLRRLRRDDAAGRDNEYGGNDLARLLGRLASWRPLETSVDRTLGDRQELRRQQRLIEQAATALSLVDEVQFDPAELAPALDIFLDTLSGPAPMNRDVEEQDMVFRAAEVVRLLFPESVVGPESAIWKSVEEVADSRSDPRAALESGYGPWRGKPGGPGATALVAAGIGSEGDWEMRWQELIAPVPSLARGLARFPIGEAAEEAGLASTDSSPASGAEAHEPGSDAATTDTPPGRAEGATRPDESTGEFPWSDRAIQDLVATNRLLSENLALAMSRFDKLLELLSADRTRSGPASM